LCEFPRRGPFEICWIPPDGAPYQGPGGHAMKLVARSLTLVVVVSLIVGGPLATFARAQQPAEPAQPPEPSRGVVKMIGGLSEAALYTAGAENRLCDEKGTGRSLHGVKQIIEAWQGWGKAIPDSKATFVAEHGSGDTAVLEVVWKGVHTGPLQTPTGTIPASNKRIEVPA